jgi:nucleotide-binding universal stress UspA family protein
MSEALSSPQRILVALDGSPQSRAALDAAVRLAVVFGAEVRGLFVEDERLLRAARLPFVKEVRSHGAPPRRLSGGRVQRQLRRQAGHAERALRRRARQGEVPHAFRTVQGDVTQELRRAAEDADLLVLGKTSTASSRRRLGSTSRSLLADAPSPVLVLRTRLPAEEPVLVYYDGSAAAEAALRLATRLARRAAHSALDVLLPAHDEAETERLRGQVRARDDVPPLSVRLHPLTRAEGRRLSAFVRKEGGLVLLPAGCPPLGRASLQQFLYEIDRPLLVVR